MATETLFNPCELFCVWNRRIWIKSNYSIPSLCFVDIFFHLEKGAYFIRLSDFHNFCCKRFYMSFTTQKALWPCNFIRNCKWFFAKSNCIRVQNNFPSLFGGNMQVNRPSLWHIINTFRSFQGTHAALAAPLFPRVKYNIKCELQVACCKFSFTLR